MTRVLELNLPHAAFGVFVAESAGRRLLFVHTDLRPEQAPEIEILRASLDKLAQESGEFDNFEIELMERADAPRS